MLVCRYLQPEPERETDHLFIRAVELGSIFKPCVIFLLHIQITNKKHLDNYDFFSLNVNFSKL